MTREEDSPIVIYEDTDKAVEVRLDTARETVWLTQAQMAELFDVKPQNVTMHLKSIYAEGELIEEGTCKDFLQVQREGERRVKRNRKHYSLDAVISVGYRISSARATQFRIWATRVLREHLTRGWTLDRQRFEANARELEAAMELVRRTARSPELGLEEKGYSTIQLAEVARMIEAENSDLYEVLAYIAFERAPVSWILTSCRT